MMLKRQDAFTLVELLAVIIILGIILVLAVPRVSDMISKYRDKAYERQIDLILNAAEKYSILYEDEINWIGNEATITLKELQEKDLIASPTKNPKGGEFDSESFTIILTRLENGSIDYAINVEGEGGHYTAQELQDMIDNQGYIEVATASDLDNVRGDLEGKYVQVANIDLSDYANWVPIGEVTIEQFVYGDFSTIFIGTFDGNNYTINNLTINMSDDNWTEFGGLFGVIFESSLQNIRIINADIKGAANIGALVGVSGSSMIANCSSTGNVEGGSVVGGLIVESGSVVGGLIGSNGVSYLGVTGGMIKNCFSECNVEGNEYVGGLLGENMGNITNSYATGNVEAFGNRVGGLVGQNTEGLIIDSYSNGNVKGNDYDIGGLVGSNYYSQIINCYATGFVTGKGLRYEGGLIGDVMPGSIVTSSYWDTDTSGQSTSAGGTGKTTSEMKQQNTYESWDFTDIWNIDEGVTYPYFR